MKVAEQSATFASTTKRVPATSYSLQVGSQNSGSSYYGVQASFAPAALSVSASGPLTAAKKIKIPEGGKERTNKLVGAHFGSDYRRRYGVCRRSNDRRIRQRRRRRPLFCHD